MFPFQTSGHKILKAHYEKIQPKTLPLHCIVVMTALAPSAQADESLLREQEKSDSRLLLQVGTTDVLTIDAYKAQLCA